MYFWELITSLHSFKLNNKMKKLFLIIVLILSSVCCFSQSRYISETTKKIVYTRDGGVCKCCRGSISLEYDHIIPFSCGGSSTVSNIQLLCQKCNRSKSNSCYCKVHNRKVGTNCCENESNKKSTTTSSQCFGITKSGMRCRNKTTNSNGRCHLHQ